MNSIVDPRYEAWLEAGRVFAERMIAAKCTYADARAALQFYFTRKAVELAKGTYVGAALSIGVRPETARRFIAWRVGGSGLRPEDWCQAELWASSLAIAGAKYREALFIWSRCLLLAAIEACKGNRLAASRLLAVHRNTMWRVPSSPDQTTMAMTKHRRTASAAA